MTYSGAVHLTKMVGTISQSRIILGKEGNGLRGCQLAIAPPYPVPKLESNRDMISSAPLSIIT